MTTTEAPRTTADSPARSQTDTVGVVIFCIVVFFYWAAMYIYVPILPVHARTLGASATLIGLLVGAYGFSQMVLRIPIGVISDRWGRRLPFISFGFVASGVGALGLATTSSPELLIVFRGIAGISAATWVASTVLFTGYFSPGETARAIGLLSFVGGVAQLVATTAGGFIADEVGAAAPFFAAVGISVIGLALTFAIRENRIRRTPPSMRRLVAVGTVPSLILISLITALIQYASWASTYSFVPLYAAGLGAEGTELGLLTGASLVLYTATTLVVAPLAARVGVRGVIVAGLLLMGASIVVVPAITTLGLLAVSQALGGIGRGLASTILMSESIRSIEPAERATAMGVFQAVYAIGMFVGPATAGVLADTLGLSSAFWVSGALVMLGIPITLAAIGRNSQPQATG